jgi:hypothetical protein
MTVEIPFDIFRMRENQPGARMRKALPLALIPFVLAFWAGCGTEPKAKGDKLEITGSPLPSPFRVGDTSGLWTASKTVILPTGRAEKTSNYEFFELVSSDSTVVGVAAGRLLVGRSPGTAQVGASDNRSGLSSESTIEVTVIAR